ncbi:Protein of unknown function [Bacillus cytotoxicus]|uniref:Uncharacterized protein n=1 Tax=Bacillus cytotoxicus TaxID=580165 RepID=A0AAX2CEM7_9BACI|nr:Protein of unknown function [Bacillus cytotoxicus]SCN33621.1 Protein of unknown function [Bacillus cytotoxicus]
MDAFCENRLEQEKWEIIK